MPIAHGFLSKAALRRDALTTSRVWPAASPAAATALLPLLSESVRERPERVSPAVSAPGAYEPTPTLVARRVEGDLALLGTYQGLETIWALALGHMNRRYSGTLFPQTVATGVYKHRFEVDARLGSKGWEAGSGFVAGTDALTAGTQKIRRASFVVDKQQATFEAKSAMLGSIELEATSDAVVLRLVLVAHSLSRASATNPNLSGVTTPDFVPVAFHHLVLRIAAYSTSTALASGDALTVSGVRLALDNRLTAAMTPHDGLYIGEPERSGKAVVQGTLFVPRYQSETLLTWAANGTALMADLVFTGPTIPGTASSSMLSIYLPTLVLDEAEAPTTGPELTKLSVPFRAYVPAATPAGFPQSVKGGPVIIEVVSSQANHPLLAA